MKRRWWKKYVWLLVVFLVVLSIIYFTLKADGSQTGASLLLLITIIYLPTLFLIFIIVFIFHDVLIYFRKRKSSE
jgi:hypothetical protein